MYLLIIVVFGNVTFLLNLFPSSNFAQFSLVCEPGSAQLLCGAPGAGKGRLSPQQYKLLLLLLLINLVLILQLLLLLLQLLLLPSLLPQVFAMLASVESVVPIIGTTFYTTLYNNTKLLAYPAPGTYPRF